LNFFKLLLAFVFDIVYNIDNERQIAYKPTRNGAQKMQELAKIYNAKTDLAELSNTAEIINFVLDQLDTSERTRETYKRNIRGFIEYIENNGLNLKTATHQTVVSYKRTLEQQGYKAGTINSYLTAVRAIYKVLESELGYTNITANVKNEKHASASAKDALTIEQAKTLLQEPKDGASLQELRDYALINLCIKRGLRTIEIARADISDIRNNQGHTVLYVQGKGHTSKDNFVILSTEILNPILRYLSARGCKDKNAPLFAGCCNRNNGARLTTRTISRIIKSAMIERGINSDTLTAHSLRHTAVTFALIGGATLQETQQMARHANINTTLIYAHNLDRLKGNAESAIDKLLSA
jgi:integrase/recombinase XerD